MLDTQHPLTKTLNVLQNWAMIENIDDLKFALEFVSSSMYDETSAFLNKETGKIFYDSDAEVLPEDLYENDQYIEIPSKRDLDLGKPLVLEFVGEFLPDDLNTVYSIFRRKGAYSRFKALLDDRNQLEKWHAYEEAAQEKALLSWCKVNGIDLNL